MALYKKSDLRRKILNEGIRKSFVTDSFEKLAKASLDDQFDIFLSHRYMDADEISVITSDLQKNGFSVYVDWVVDEELDRNKITKETAERLRLRMKSCKSLFFVTTENSSDSKWMPWELGFMDAMTSRVAILPVIDDDKSSMTYAGQEYLGIYPYIDNDADGIFFVNEASDCYVVLASWLKGANPSQR